MANHDFEVDLEALIGAAQKTAEVVQLKKDHDVEDYVPSQASIANDILWDAVDEFQSRWERGINDMTDDIEEVSGRLGKVAMNYSEYNEGAEKEMKAVQAAIAALSTERMLETGD